MPVFTAIATAVVSAIGLTGFAASVASFVVRALAVSVVSSLIGRPSSPAASSASQETGSRVQLPPATNNKLPVVYGSAFMSPVMFDAVISTDQQTMWYVGAICEATDQVTSPVINFDDPNNAGYPLMYWGDRKLIFNSTNRTQVDTAVDDTGTSGNVSFKPGDMTVYFYRSGSADPLYGAPAATTVLSDSAIATANRWPTSNKMWRTAFVIVKIRYNQDVPLLTGLQQITVLVNNNISSGAAKPGDVMMDYLRSTRYGCGVPVSAIDVAAFQALNTYSDQVITFTPAGGGATTTQPRYRINGPLDTTQNCLTNLQNIAESCDSWLQWNEAKGQWSVIVNRSYQPTSFEDLYSITSNNIIGGINITPLDFSATYNRLEVQFPSRLIKDQTDFAFLDLATYKNTPLSPNEPINTITLQLPLVNDSVQAQYLGIRRLLQSRDDLIISFTMDYSGIQLNAGDVVKVSHEYYGWGPTQQNPDQLPKLFRIIQVQESLSMEGVLGATLTLTEYNDTVYADKAIQQFSEARNTGITDPSVISAPSSPVITNAVLTATIPSFQVSTTLGGANTGTVTAIEFWYSTGNAAIENNNYLLYGTQQYAGAATYPPGDTETITVTGLPTGAYYWRARAVNQVAKSSFSSASTLYNWQPNPTANVLGQTFQSYWSPGIISVPYSNFTPNFFNIQPRLYGALGGGGVEFDPAQTDAAQANGTWRIGANANTGYTDVVYTSGLVFPNQPGNTSPIADRGTYAEWTSATSMVNNPSYIDVPVRYKDANGVVSNTATFSTRLQLVYQIAGATGAAGAAGYQVIAPRVYFLVPANFTQAPTVTGGVWNVQLGQWATRPTTTVNGAVVTNSDTVVSIPNTQTLRYVAQPYPVYTNQQVGDVSFTTNWPAPVVDSGYGPKGNDGFSPVDISINLSAGGIYRDNANVYSPASISLQATVLNYPAPVPTPTWSVTNGSPLTGTGNSITVTPTGTQPIQITYNIGSYFKNVVIPIVSQGAPGPQGPAGTQGAAGTRGFTPLGYIPVNFDASTATDSQRSTAWQNTLGYPPVSGDGAAFFNTTTNTSWAARFNGTTWIPAALFVPGDVIATGTVRAAALSATDVFTNKLSSTNQVATFGQNTGNGYWLDGFSGNAYFGGNVAIGNNLTVAGIITGSNFNTSVIKTINVAPENISTVNVVPWQGQRAVNAFPQFSNSQGTLANAFVINSTNITLQNNERALVQVSTNWFGEGIWTTSTGERQIWWQDGLVIDGIFYDRVGTDLDYKDFYPQTVNNGGFRKFATATNWPITNISGGPQTYLIQSVLWFQPNGSQGPNTGTRNARLGLWEAYNNFIVITYFKR